MRLDDLPPEMLHVIAYGGLLENTDVLNLALSSQSLAGDLLGDCYGKDHFRALSGVSACVYYNWVRAVCFAIQNSEDYNHAICLAAEDGRIEIVARLLADPRFSADSNLAIRLAAENGHTKIVALLLADPRVDPTVVSNIAICMAVLKGYTEIVELLLADPRVDPCSVVSFF